MATIDRAVRRQRILKGSEDRLALITGRLQDFPPLSPGASAKSPPLVSRDPAAESPLFCGSQDKPMDEGIYRNVGEVNYKSWSVYGSKHLIKCMLNFCGSISSKQLSIALAATEQSRMVFSITMALFVLMSQFELSVFGYKFIRSVFLSGPLIFLLLTDITLIAVMLLPGMKRDKAGGIVEVSFMVHDVLKAFSMDFILYSLIVVCGFCLTC